MKEDKRSKISGNTAAYVAETIEHFVRLEAAIEDLRWRLHRGEPQMMRASAAGAKRLTRKLIGSIEMLQMCLREYDSEPETTDTPIKLLPK